MSYKSEYEVLGWEDALFDELRRVPNLSRACRVVDEVPSLSSVQSRMDACEEFRSLVEDARAYGVDELERFVFDAATSDLGTAKWLLTHHRPEVYSSKRIVKVEREVHGDPVGKTMDWLSTLDEEDESDE